MAILRRAMSYQPLDAATIERWRKVPPAVAGDNLNREHCMGAPIQPLAPGFAMVGHARTIAVMAGDNAAVHAALPLMQPGEILVITARGASDVAIIGEIIAECAKKQGIAGIVVDGAVRDVAALRTIGFPVYAASATPRGPHKGFGGEIDAPVACGGVVVCPGDLILGDDDGVTVVPRALCDETLPKAEAQVAKEAAVIAKVRSGVSTAEIQGIPVPEVTPAG